MSVGLYFEIRFEQMAAWTFYKYVVKIWKLEESI